MATSHERWGHLHKVVLEEILQLPLGGRVREVSNVKSPSLGGAGQDSLVLGGCGLGSGGLGGVFEGGGGHLGGDTVDRSGHVDVRVIKDTEYKRASNLRKLEVRVDLVKADREQ